MGWPRLAPNWPTIMRLSWAFRWSLLAGFTAGGECLMQVLGDYALLPPGILAGLSAFFAFAATVSRLVAQVGLTQGIIDNRLPQAVRQ